MLAIHAVPAFKDNYIWMLEEGGEAVAVDPGDDAPVEAFLRDRGLRLAAVGLKGSDAHPRLPGSRSNHPTNITAPRRGGRPTSSRCHSQRSAMPARSFYLDGTPDR